MDAICYLHATRQLWPLPDLHQGPTSPLIHLLEKVPELLLNTIISTFQELFIWKFTRWQPSINCRR